MGNKAYQLCITLNHTDPEVMRRISVPETMRLEELHDVIQTIFGWMGYHMHQFENLSTHQIYSPDPEDLILPNQVIEKEDSSLTVLRDVFQVNDRWEYWYDFGDNWEHIILIEALIECDGPANGICLLDWQGDNLAEDAGGVYGYYEKVKIMNDKHHPDHKAISEWMRMQHIPFDEMEVRQELTLDHAEEYPTEEEEQIGDLLLEYFTMTQEETLLIVPYEDKELYIRFLNVDQDKAVHIYTSKDDFDHSYFGRFGDFDIHGLYQNGYEITYPNYDVIEEAEFLLESMIGVTVTYHSYGQESKPISDEETQWIKGLAQYIHDAFDEVELEFDLLPDLCEKEAVRITYEQDRYHVQKTTYIPSLSLTPLTLTAKEREDLNSAKISTERLLLHIMQIPTFVHEDRSFLYYFVCKGKKSSWRAALDSSLFEQAIQECKEYLVKYMKGHGVPKQIRTKDTHLYMMLQPIMTDLHVDFQLKTVHEYEFKEQFDLAFQEANPLSEEEAEELIKMMDMEEDELMAYLDSLSREQGEALLSRMMMVGYLDE